jgi:glutathione S-transferase
MKLYYATGTCSLSPRIVAEEAGIALDGERVDLRTHLTERGRDYTEVNPNGYVPLLELDDGTLLSEGVAIVQYLADRAPEAGLLPPAGTTQRYRQLAWLGFVATELHKSFSPWLFHAEYGAAAQAAARARIRQRLGFVEAALGAGGPWLMGAGFTAADAYLFTICLWSPLVGIDLAPFPALRRFMDRVAARPAVQRAMAAEGMKAAA